MSAHKRRRRSRPRRMHTRGSARGWGEGAEEVRADRRPRSGPFPSSPSRQRLRHGEETYFGAFPRFRRGSIF
eukprot:scaffold114214_cov30-Tisochrysis_lutea.AAC.1